MYSVGTCYVYSIGTCYVYSEGTCYVYSKYLQNKNDICFGGPRRAERNVFCDRGQRRFGTSQMLPPTYCLPTFNLSNVCNIIYFLTFFPQVRKKMNCAQEICNDNCLYILISAMC